MQEYVTLVVAGIGIVGSLSGVIVGQRMSRSWQREQWVLDRRVQEFRELLDALADDFRVAMTMHVGAVIDSDGQREIVESHSTAMQVIRSRIFVFEEVTRLNIELRWTTAVNHHRQTFDVERLATVFTEIRVQIVNAARPVLSAQRLPWCRRLFGRKRSASAN